MPAAFSSPGTESLRFSPRAVPLDAWEPIRRLAIQRVLSDGDRHNVGQTTRGRPP